MITHTMFSRRNKKNIHLFSRALVVALFIYIYHPDSVELVLRCISSARYFLSLLCLLLHAGHILSVHLSANNCICCIIRIGNKTNIIIYIYIFFWLNIAPDKRGYPYFMTKNVAGTHFCLCTHIICFYEAIRATVEKSPFLELWEQNCIWGIYKQQKLTSASASIFSALIRAFTLCWQIQRTLESKSQQLRYR